MFSRLAHSTGRVAPGVQAWLLNAQSGESLLITTRAASFNFGDRKVEPYKGDLTFRKVVKYQPDLKVTMENQLDNWAKADHIFFGPDRDTKNFPFERRPKDHPPVRFAFIPESWFKFFYDKTGVTGPYVFATGFVTFLLSKELWVVEHGFTDFVCFWALIIFIYKRTTWVQQWEAYAEKKNKELDEMYDKPYNEAKASHEEGIREADKMVWREEGQVHLFEAKKENVDLQLEEEYRRRQMEVYKALKSRLDFQVATQNARRRYEQSHMVNWIVESVRKGITPQQEKDSITKCLSDLKLLAKKSAGTALS